LKLAMILLGVAIAVFAALTALGVGGSSRRELRAEPARVRAPLATYAPGAPHVLSSLAPYTPPHPVEGRLTEPAPEALVRAPGEFIEPVARYRVYSLAQLDLMQKQMGPLRAALAANDRIGAKEAWRRAFATYLRVGGVYLQGNLAELNEQIDGTPGGVPGGVSNPQFAGLHRIEYGLWTGAKPRGLVGYATQLGGSVSRMRAALVHVPITPLEYATRAHEILEDAQRDLLSGAAVPWSGEGVLGTASGLQATERIMATLRTVIPRDTRVVPTVSSELSLLRRTLAALVAIHGGRFPTNQQLTQRQAIQLDGALGGVLEALATVPDALETEHRHPPTPIPARDLSIDR
jgi:iron uptake system EfeUOB component EfeO/EfeM